MVGYAYILTHPGIPSIFWDHICDWGDDVRNKIGILLKLRTDSGIEVAQQVELCSISRENSFVMLDYITYDMYIYILYMF